MAKVTRYSALTPKGAVIQTGKRLGDVQGIGPRIIVDWHQRRYTIEGHYPVARPYWRKGLNKIGDILRSA